MHLFTALIQSFIHPSIHLFTAFIHSSNYSQHSIIHKFIHSYINIFTPFIHSFIHLFTPLIRPITHPFKYSSIHSPIHPLIHPIHSMFHSLIHPPIHPIHSHIHPPIHLIHSTSPHPHSLTQCHFSTHCHPVLPLNFHLGLSVAAYVFFLVLPSLLQGCWQVLSPTTKETNYIIIFYGTCRFITAFTTAHHLSLP